VNEKETDGSSGEDAPFDQMSEPFVVKPAADADEFTLVEPVDVEKAPEPLEGDEPAVSTDTEKPPQPEPHRVFAGTGISWAFIFGAILTAAIIILAVQNTDPVPVKLYFWETEAPLIIVMLVTALVVVLIDEMIGLIIRRRKRRVLAEREELKRLRARAHGQGPEIE
jgi:uncharacterized integral membrane protein